MGGETPVRNVTSRIPPPSTSILPITKTPLMDRPISHGSQLKNAPARSRRSSFASSNGDVTRPLSTPRQSRRLSTADLPDLNTTSLSTKSSTSGAEIGETPHLPRYMMGTVSSNGPSPFSSSSSTRIPLPVRVSSNRNSSSGKMVPTPSSIGSIASLNELSFSSDRCGPSKRGAEKIEGRTLRGGGVLKNIIPPLKRRRFDEIEEAVFKEKISDDEKVKRFEEKFEKMWLVYEKDIAPILEKKNEMEKENDQRIDMKKEDLTEEEETNSEKITTSDDGNTMKKKNEREETPRGLDRLAERFACIRDALTKSRRKI